MIVSRKFDGQSGEKISRRPWPSVFWKWDSSIAATRDTFRRLSCSYLLLLLCAPQTRAWLFTFELHILFIVICDSLAAEAVAMTTAGLFCRYLEFLCQFSMVYLTHLCIAITRKRLYTRLQYYDVDIEDDWLLMASDVCRYGNEYRGEI